MGENALLPEDVLPLEVWAHIFALVEPCYMPFVSVTCKTFRYLLPRITREEGDDDDDDRKDLESVLTDHFRCYRLHLMRELAVRGDIVLMDFAMEWFACPPPPPSVLNSISPALEPDLFCRVLGYLVDHFTPSENAASLRQFCASIYPIAVNRVIEEDTPAMFAAISSITKIAHVTDELFRQSYNHYAAKCTESEWAKMVAIPEYVANPALLLEKACVVGTHFGLDICAAERGCMNVHKIRLAVAKLQQYLSGDEIYYNMNGHSALCLVENSIQCGQAKFVEELLDMYPWVSTSGGLEPRWYGNVETVRLLRGRELLRDGCTLPDSAFHYAIWCAPSLELVQALIALKPTVQSLPSWRWPVSVGLGPHQWQEFKRIREWVSLGEVANQTLRSLLDKFMYRHLKYAALLNDDSEVAKEFPHSWTDMAGMFDYGAIQCMRLIQHPNWDHFLEIFRVKTSKHLKPEVVRYLCTQDSHLIRIGGKVLLAKWVGALGKGLYPVAQELAKQYRRLQRIKGSRPSVDARGTWG